MSRNRRSLPSLRDGQLRGLGPPYTLSRKSGGRNLLVWDRMYTSQIAAPAIMKGGTSE